jgi:flavin reductase (DIM6/NTAB) family NADH-FMN oxidoreductase RutF
VPVLEHSVFHLICEVSDVFADGDHSLFLAAPVAGSLGTDFEPLVYVEREYRRPGDCGRTRMSGEGEAA